ncbi:MAG: oligosaccharide biosynthesis protein Alg14 [Sphingobacteriaceae bacterium]|nr:MAG: oligosaccharide biosynthesis protein Alg14 [Sphingobacteriaceae bacterium]
MPLFKANDVSFISTKASLENTVEGHKYYAVPDANRNNKFNLIRCCLSIGWFVLSSRPEIIITTGAAPGLFGIFVGKILGIKTVWIDSMANVEKLSLSGNIALKIADRVYTQWEHLSTPKVVFAGNILEE